MRQFKNKQWVWWTDPAGETSGWYQILDTFDERNAEVREEDIAEYDDRIILIGNGYSEAEVYAAELSSPRVRVVLRQWSDHAVQEVVALFPDIETNTERHTILTLEPKGRSDEAVYQEAIRNSEEITEKMCAPLLAELRNAGFEQVQVITHREYQHEQIMEYAAELADLKLAQEFNKLPSAFHNRKGGIKKEYEDAFADYYESAYAELSRLAGYEDEPENKYICSICGQPTFVLCEASVNPNTKEFHEYGDEAFYHAYCKHCEEEVVLIDKKMLYRDIDLFYANFLAEHGTAPRYARCRIVHTDIEHDSENDGTEYVDILIGPAQPTDDCEVFCQCNDIDALKALAIGQDRDFALVECFSMS